MGKAVLLLDMPENCAECPVADEYGICEKTGDMTDDYFNGKPDSCPLIPEPKRQLNSAQHVIGESQKTGKDPKLIGGYHMGWNACLDALEGR